MEARLSGPAPEPDSQREKDFQEVSIPVNMVYNFLVKCQGYYLEPGC